MASSTIFVSRLVQRRPWDRFWICSSSPPSATLARSFRTVSFTFAARAFLLRSRVGQRASSSSHVERFLGAAEADRWVPLHDRNLTAKDRDERDRFIEILAHQVSIGNGTTPTRRPREDRAMWSFFSQERRNSLVRGWTTFRSGMDRAVARGRATRARHVGHASCTCLCIHGCNFHRYSPSFPFDVVGPRHTIANCTRNFEQRKEKLQVEERNHRFHSYRKRMERW